MKFKAACRTVFAALGLGLSAAASAAIQFGPVVNYPTGADIGPGPAPQGGVAADFNNDGRPDVILINWLGFGLIEELNQGNGVFKHVALPSELWGQGLATADLNNDGNPDLVVTTLTDVVVLLGRGDGTFTELERHPFIIGAQEQTVIVDLNHDGILDLVTITLRGLGGIKVFLGTGGGHFVSGPFTSVVGAISAVAVANLNGDSIPDLAVLSATSLGLVPVSSVVSLMGNGDGTFRTASRKSFKGIISEDIATGDINGDGIDDVVTGDSFSFTISVLLSDGNGNFNQIKTLNGKLGPVSISLTDLDGDGKLDIVEAVVVNPVVQVFPGLGHGQFGPPLVLRVTPFPQTPILADFFGHHKLDMAVGGPFRMSVMENLSH